MANTDVTTANPAFHDEPDGYNLALSRRLISAPSDDIDNAIVKVNTGTHEVGIKPGDLVRIDFTATSIREGVYLITLDDEWIGFRLFVRMPDLRMKLNGESIKISPKSLIEEIKVIGEVKAIYKEDRQW